MEAIHDHGRADLLFWHQQCHTQPTGNTLQQGTSATSFLQNRCFAVDGWDRIIRQFCKTNGMHYQGFSLLTANRDLMAHSEMARIAKRYHCTVSQIVFRFALEVGMIPLTGTNDPSHMADDLQIFDFQLNVEDVAAIEKLVMQ